MIKTLINTYGSKFTWLCFGLFFSFFIYKSWPQPIGDFGNYYFASRYLLQGNFGLWIYEPVSFNLKVYEEGYRNFFLNHTPFPPFTSLIYAPFAIFSLPVSRLIWNILSALLFTFSLSRLFQSKKISFTYALLLIPVFFSPIVNNLNQGQSYLILFSLLTEGYLAYASGKKWLSSCYWGVCILFKVYPAFVFLFLLFTKDFRSIWKLGSIVALLGLFSMIFTGIQIWLHYFQYILPRLSAGEISDSFTHYFQSAQVLLKNVFLYDQLHNPDPYIHSPWLYQLLNNTFKGVIIYFTAIASLRKTDTLQVFGLWLLAALLLSGYGTSYGLCVFCLCLITWINQGTKQMRFFPLILGLFICNFPVYLLNEYPTFFQYPRLFAMLLLWGYQVYHMRPEWRWQPGLLSLAFIVPSFFYTPANDDPYYLKKEEALLIHDFNIVNDSLELSCFNLQGPFKKTVPLNEPVDKTEPFTFTAHSLDHVIRPRENIRKAMLINNKTIVYLTDKGRGPGFYTLRYKLLP